MAGDWIKMRVWLARDPNVISMARHLATDESFALWATGGNHESLCDVLRDKSVTARVTESVTVTALLQIWGVTRRDGAPDGDDLVLRNADLETLDRIAEVPGVGAAMASVGWVLVQQDYSVRFPKLLPHITSPEERKREQAAERKRRERDRKQRDNGRDKSRTSHANVTPREEESRGDKSRGVNTDPPKSPQGGRFVKPTVEQVAAYCRERGNSVNPQQFIDHYESNGWKVGGRAPMKDWQAAVRNWEKNQVQNGGNKFFSGGAAFLADGQG